MWDRRTIKEKGKAAYRANRFMCIIAALILAFASGAGGVSIPSSTMTFNDHNGRQHENVIIDDQNEHAPNTDKEEDGFPIITPTAQSDPSDVMALLIVGSIVLVVVVIAVAIGFAISALLLNPLLVGARKFFIDNATNPSTGLDGSNIGVGFSNLWSKVVLSMFSTQIFVFLWSLLFVIPGIVKAYEWRMVSYIVSETPDISGKEARDISSAMMDGNKWDAFVLDLSFLGWQILGLFTFGILNLVFTNPYKAATDAELYLTLSGRATQIVLPEAPSVTFEV